MRDADPALAGRLYVVATPIGNWADLSPRAHEILERVALVAAEDTRYARRLFAHLGLRQRVVSCHAHNQARRLPAIQEHLRRGDDVALITDAGTPGVSDPGGVVVAAVADAGYRVVAVPGPSAATAAVSISGLGGRGFVFLGYLPRARGKRRGELQRYRAEPRPLVLYESPRRVRALLADAQEVLGDRPAVVARELTKTHEEVLRGTLGEITAALPTEPRGEFAVVLGPAAPGELASTVPPADREALIRRHLAAGGRPSRAARALARELGVARAAAYRLLLAAAEREEEAGDGDGDAAPAPDAPVRLVFHGHPGIKATHHKSLELKAPGDCGPRETCVVAVGGAWDPEVFRGLPARLEVTLAAGAHEVRFTATRNPRFRSAASLVFRASRYNDQRTLGVEATLSARDLDRALAAALQEPATEVVLTIRGAS